jgi:DeoR/GlpR family transcriptional regulator of sugar metabolism
MIQIDTEDHSILAEERRAILLRELNENGYIRATELAEKLNITAITIRRDLARLEAEGLCIRKRGGAVRSSQSVTLELPYQVKQNSCIAEKKRIAAEAVKLVIPGSTIILDSGSTTYALALLLSQKRITVVTNDLQIAVKLAANPNINLICTGGVAKANVFSLHGAQVESFIRSLRVDITFLAADAIHADGTVANVNLEEALLKQALIQAADRVVLLADSSKFNKTGFAKVCNLADLEMIITDCGISKEEQEFLASVNIQAHIV